MTPEEQREHSMPEYREHIAPEEEMECIAAKEAGVHRECMVPLEERRAQRHWRGRHR